MLIFPQPQSIRALYPDALEGAGGYKVGAITLASQGHVCCVVVLPDDAVPLERLAAEAAAASIARLAGQAPPPGGDGEGSVRVLVGTAALSVPAAVDALAGTPDVPEAYVVVVDRETVALLGRSPSGTFYAAQTFGQMLEVVDGRVVAGAAVVQDWPDYRYRGLYMESKWGPDLMVLQDWRDLIDYMAALKFNSLGIGVYCCWQVQYDGRRTEFLMIPFPGRPELATPKTIRYYSAKEGAWKAVSYLPRMFEEDFFGEIVAYAKSRNITVRPHFNGPGHTTLIPHTHPEVAAKDAAGRAQSYGYCLSSQATYDLLFELWDSVIDRYLAPNGIDWFHMGLDEIWPSTGVDEESPERRVDPWCQCAACRDRTPNELLVDYVLKATTHLAQKGMQNITIWNDHLERHGVLTPEFVDRLAAAGVKEKVALQWWRYEEPVLEPRPELGLRSWTTPMPGYYFWLTTQSYTSNIYPQLHLAYRKGAEGADAYCTFDPAFDRNYYCLAEYAWNQTTSGDLYQFKSRYAQKVMGTTGFDAVEAFDKWDQVYDSFPLVRGPLDALLLYWYTYSQERRAYPRQVARAYIQGNLRSARTYRLARLYLARARAFFAVRREAAPDPALIDEYMWECERMVAVIDAYEALATAARKIGAAGSLLADSVSLADAGKALRQGLAGLDAMMARAEEVKKPYLVPQILRDLSPLRAFASELLAAVDVAFASTEGWAGLRSTLADLMLPGSKDS